METGQLQVRDRDSRGVRADRKEGATLPCTFTKTVAQAGSLISKVNIKAIFKRGATLLQATMGQDWLNEGLTCKDRPLITG